jgi:putative FmdB family regulatory protein
MPLYEYECLSCNCRFELRRGIEDSDGDLKCPKCGAEHPRRVLSIFATGPSSSPCGPSAFT